MPQEKNVYLPSIKKENMFYSVIIPVYNRPDEVDELLQSLAKQEYKHFEVIIVEDGSTVPCQKVADRYNGLINLHYYTQPNSGPGQARNYGATHAKGEYIIILDSDCLLPPNYFIAIENELQHEPCDAFGGPDKAHPSFTNMQKAINYAMTSFFTTGGIRGGKHKMDRFYPRSFNMGIRTETYKTLGGFSTMRFGEDIDFSIRILQAGYSSRLFPDAWVYHKRRANLRQFFKQVHNFGMARINLYKKYPSSLKAVHMLPALFTVGTFLLIVTTPLCLWALTPLLAFAAVIFTDATKKERNAKVGTLAVAAAFCQLTGYGSGFIRAWWQRIVRGKDEFSAFNKSFYK